LTTLFWISSRTLRLGWLCLIQLTCTGLIMQVWKCFFYYVFLELWSHGPKSSIFFGHNIYTLHILWEVVGYRNFQYLVFSTCSSIYACTLLGYCMTSLFFSDMHIMFHYGWINIVSRIFFSFFSASDISVILIQL
jgi:hypothetical protein